MVFNADLADNLLGLLVFTRKALEREERQSLIFGESFFDVLPKGAKILLDIQPSLHYNEHVFKLMNGDSRYVKEYFY